ncbi:LysB family phage lysis regulatory protein [Burkholderia sp. Bp9140]|uniref:Rz-like lysis system protein LysB n=1 Tax=Burkholderia sp. Bp9140 TaxID=2184572 RepID=UPI000F55FE87|nr:Rz-like lysis system protein LysB [Burkholderia sp. Bp9140]RQR50466.1 LysB family phage lysis regulatory protein [Burkholderia sp. Bp9140]
MTAVGARVVVVVAAAGVAFGGWQYVRALRLELHQASAAAAQAKQSLSQRDDVIDRLLRDANEKDEQRAQLEKTRQAVDAALAAYRKELRSLIDENPAVREWAATPLPDDVRRLHARPAATGADDYGQRMRGGEPLHDGGDRTPN